MPAPPGDLVVLALADGVAGPRMDGAERARAAGAGVARVGLLNASEQRIKSMVWIVYVRARTSVVMKSERILIL